LNTATDRQDRLPILERTSGQFDLDIVLQRIGVAQSRMARGAVGCGIDIFTASQEQSVDLLVERVQHIIICGEMDEHRGASGCFDCLEIINNVPVDFGKPGVVSGKVGDTNQAWNADDRAVRVRHVKLLEQFFIRYIVPSRSAFGFDTRASSDYDPRAVHPKE
jgi:hypothetical protein